MVSRRSPVRDRASAWPESAPANAFEWSRAFLLECASLGASSEAGLVEHRDECRAAVMLAKIRDPGREPFALAGGFGRAVGLLEHRYGPGVRPAAATRHRAILAPPARTPRHPYPQRAAPIPLKPTRSRRAAAALTITPEHLMQCASASLVDDQTSSSSRATVSRLIVKALARSRKREPRDLLDGATRSYDARKRSMSAVSRASAGAGVGRANHAGSGRPFLMDQVPVAAPRLSTTGLNIPPPLRM